MIERCMYLASVVAVGWAVTFALRALPFMLFAGRSRELPKWVGALGGVVSPVIIACLVVYSYSGLEWRTAWPYLAGLLTVGLQLWRRNPLFSIVAGTALYMCLLSCGCVSVPAERLVSSVGHPIVRVTRSGMMFLDEYVTPDDVVKRLEDNGVAKDKTLHVLVDADFDDQQILWVFKHNYLDRAGYTKSVMIHERHGASGDSDMKPDERGVVIPYKKRFQKQMQQRQPTAPSTRQRTTAYGQSEGRKTIRYKKADE